MSMIEIKRKSRMIINNGNISFTCTSGLYGTTDAGGRAIHVLKLGFVSLGDGCSYKLSDLEKKQLKRLFKKELKELLVKKELQVFTCVKLAIILLDRGDIETAIKKLQVDADKIRTINDSLYEIIK